MMRQSLLLTTSGHPASSPPVAPLHRPAPNLLVCDYSASREAQREGCQPPSRHRASTNASPCTRCRKTGLADVTPKTSKVTILVPERAGAKNARSTVAHTRRETSFPCGVAGRIR